MLPILNLFQAALARDSEDYVLALAQNTTMTSLCWSKNTLSLIEASDFEQIDIFRHFVCIKLNKSLQSPKYIMLAQIERGHHWFSSLQFLISAHLNAQQVHSNRLGSHSPVEWFASESLSFGQQLRWPPPAIQTRSEIQWLQPGKYGILTTFDQCAAVMNSKNSCSKRGYSRIHHSDGKHNCTRRKWQTAGHHMLAKQCLLRLSGDPFPIWNGKELDTLCRHLWEWVVFLNIHPPQTLSGPRDTWCYGGSLECRQWRGLHPKKSRLC